MARLRMIVAAAALAVAAGGVGTFYVYKRTTRPVARAEQALAAGDARTAIVALRNATRDDPKDARSFLLLGQAQELAGDQVAAERNLKRARALGADRIQVALHLAPLYLGNRQFQEVLAETPANAPDPNVAARLLAYRSRASLGLNDQASAARSLQAAAKLAPNEPNTLLATARLALARNDAAAAATAVDATLAADPTNLEALLLEAQFKASSADPAAALPFADRAVAAGPLLANPRIVRATNLLAIGDDAKARADLDAAIAIQPRNAQAIYLSAVVAIRQERFNDAITWFESLGAAESRFPRAPYFQALAALGKGRPATAVEFADRYVARTPGDPDGIRLLARAQTANGRPDLAAALLKAAIDKGLADPRTLDLYGNAVSSMGDLGTAATAYAGILAQLPDDPAVATQLARIDVQRGDFDQALNRLDKAEKAAPEQPELLANLTTAQIAAGELDQAAATLARLKALAGPTEAAGTLTGTLALARMDTAGAIDAYSATAKAFPAAVAPQLNLARALAAAGRLDDARARLAAILAKDAANIPALTGLVQLDVDADRYAAAIRALEAARTAAPANEPVAAMLVDVQIRAGDPLRAVATATRARVAGRLQPVLLAALARAQAAAGQPDNAAQTYRDILAEDVGPTPVVEASLGLAALEQRRGATPAAAAVLDKAIARVPADFALLTRRVQLEADTAGPNAARRLAATLRAQPAQMPTAAVLAGDLAMRDNRPRDAVLAFQQERPATLALTLRLAEAQIAAGDDDAAIETLRPLPHDPSAALLRAQVAMRTKRWPDAARMLEQALRGRPNDPALLNNLAATYQALSDPRARATAQRAFLIDPNPDNADTLGWIIAQKDPADAVTLLQRAATARPDDPAIAYHLASALSRSGKTDDARSLLRRALASRTAFDERAAATALATSLN